MQSLNRNEKSTNNMLLSFISGTSTDVCSGNHLYQNYTFFEGNRSVITGIPLGCLGTGHYAALCNDGTNQPSSASVVCANRGFPGQL